MNEKIKILLIPLAVVLLYILSYFLWQYFHLPSQEELLVIFQSLFSKYGLWIVFIGALIEGLLLLGNYFPGSLIIFLGVISAGKNIPKVLEILILVSIAFFVSYFINYLLGKYGWYRLFVKFGLSKLLSSTKEKLEKRGLVIIFFTYWMPNLAALTATSSGILKIPLSKFLVFSGVGIVVWNIFWGTAVLFLGQSALQILGPKFIFLLILFWASYSIFNNFKSRMANSRRKE